MLTVKDGIKFGFGMLLARTAWSYVTTLVLHYSKQFKRQVEKSQKDQPEQDKITVLNKES